MNKEISNSLHKQNLDVIEYHIGVNWEDGNEENNIFVKSVLKQGKDFTNVPILLYSWKKYVEQYPKIPKNYLFSVNIIQNGVIISCDIRPKLSLINKMFVFISQQNVISYRKREFKNGLKDIPQPVSNPTLNQKSDVSTNNDQTRNSKQKFVDLSVSSKEWSNNRVLLALNSLNKIADIKQKNIENIRKLHSCYTSERKSRLFRHPTSSMGLSHLTNTTAFPQLTYPHNYNNYLYRRAFKLQNLYRIVSKNSHPLYITKMKSSYSNTSEKSNDGRREKPNFHENK